MKTSLMRMVVLAGAAFNLICASPTRGDESASVQKDKIFKGTVTAMDQGQKTVSVKDFWGTKTFNVGNTCAVSLQDQPSASLADLRPGQKVEVGYKKNGAGASYVRAGTQFRVDPQTGRPIKRKA